jgi:prepilin-type N-terminal cleavage/methylation domain-containing protein
VTRNQRAGVTLIELLIAITLVSLLTVGIMFAMRIGLNSMERSNSRLISNRRVVGVDRVMHQQLAGFIPVKAECKLDPNQPGSFVAFFEGERQTMRLATTFSLEEGSRGYPRILEYQVIPGEQGRGVRLVVNEFLYSGPLSAGAACVGLRDTPLGVIGRYRPPEPSERSFVLADNLERCVFTYKEDLQEPPYERWTSEWRSSRYPSAIRIDLAPLEPDIAKLQVLPVTVALRVNRDAMAIYAQQ